MCRVPDKGDAAGTFMRSEPFGPVMPAAEVFDDTPFLGLARRSKRDPYRLSLFAKHLESDERPLAFLAIHGGTLVVTDHRVLEFRAHLEVHGAWNVKEFQGYEVRRELARSSITSLDHRVGSATSASSGLEDALMLHTKDGPLEILVSRGPDPTLSAEDFEILRTAILGSQAK
jgi:hypothetical protein